MNKWSDIDMTNGTYVWFILDFPYNLNFFWFRIDVYFSFFFLFESSQPVNPCFQRYSVAVYLVRVFTAADLFNQLKLCSVESAERCRERSKWTVNTLLYSLNTVFGRLDARGSLSMRTLTTYWQTEMLLSLFLQFIYSSRQTSFWSREWNCNHRPQSFFNLSGEYIYKDTSDMFSCTSRVSHTGLVMLLLRFDFP